MAAARAEAARNGWAVTIVVADASGVPLLVQRDGAAPMTVEIAMGKARTAAISGKETGIFESIVNGREASPRLALLSSPLTLMEGAVPIIVEGAVAGAVGVSGVRSDTWGSDIGSPHIQLTDNTAMRNSNGACGSSGAWASRPIV